MRFKTQRTLQVVAALTMSLFIVCAGLVGCGGAPTSGRAGALLAPRAEQLRARVGGATFDEASRILHGGPPPAA